MRVPKRWCVVSGLLSAVLCASACGEVAGKTAVIAIGGDGDALIPNLWTQTQARVYTDLMFDKLADIGPGQNTLGDAGYEPRLATGWTWSKDSLSIAFHLDPRARWHDGRAVTARDVRFAFQVYADPKTGAAGGRDMAASMDSVSVGDSLTATVWFQTRTPEQFHSVVYNVIPLPEHLIGSVPHDSLRGSAFASHPVGSGPFRFVSWDKSKSLEMAANDAYPHGRPKLDRVVFTITNPKAAVRAVLAGDADFYERFTLDDMAEAARSSDVRVVSAPQYVYGVLEFNLRSADGKQPHPVLSSVGVRRALTMAVDRVALERNILDTLGMPGIGPFARSQWTADTTLVQLAYDTSAAVALLDSLGWRRGADGVRSRGGRPLAFAISVSSSSRAGTRYAELLQQAFARVGAKVSVDLSDQQALGARIGNHTFESALLTWTATPSPSGTRTLWGTKSMAKTGVQNAGSWSNAGFDAQVDSGLAAMAPAAARAHFKLAYQAAIDDPPAIWLYEPMLVPGMSKRLVTGPFRPDAWWQSIPAWTVTGPPRRSAGSAASSVRKP